jgi:hypothetical protein
MSAENQESVTERLLVKQSLCLWFEMLAHLLVKLSITVYFVAHLKI